MPVSLHKVNMIKLISGSWTELRDTVFAFKSICFLSLATTLFLAVISSGEITLKVVERLKFSFQLSKCTLSGFLFEGKSLISAMKMLKSNASVQN